MQIIYILYFYIIFAAATSGGKARKQPSPAASRPGTRAAQQQPAKVDGVTELLKSCFDSTLLEYVGPPKNAQFTIKARDQFRDVELVMIVTGDSLGNRCKLEWDGWLVPCGKCKSVNHETGEPVPVLATHMGPLTFAATLVQHMAGITIEIYGGENPHWELTAYSPNNLMSDNFMKSFIAQGLAIHSNLLNGKRVFLRLSDLSPSRELYWLEKQTGRTYFEDVWNLEYECLIARMDEKTRKSFYERSRVSYQATAMLALSDATFGPIKNAWSWEHPVSDFSPQFKLEIQQWLRRKGYPEDTARLSSMNLVVALANFIPQWRENPAYSQLQQVKLAQNTFMFFFRHHPNFDILARQVLYGYDDTCIFMTGVPKDDMPYKFVFEFSMELDPDVAKEEMTPDLMDILMPISGGSSGAGAQMLPQSGSPGLSSDISGLRVNSPAEAGSLQPLVQQPPGESPMLVHAVPRVVAHAAPRVEDPERSPSIGRPPSMQKSPSKDARVSTPFFHQNSYFFCFSTLLLFFYVCFKNKCGKESEEFDHAYVEL